MTASTTVRRCADCGGPVGDFSDLCDSCDGMGYRLRSGNPDNDSDPGISWGLAA